MTHRHHVILSDHSMRFRKCRQCTQWWRTNTQPHNWVTSRWCPDCLAKLIQLAPV